MAAQTRRVEPLKPSDTFSHFLFGSHRGAPMLPGTARRRIAPGSPRCHSDGRWRWRATSDGNPSRPRARAATAPTQSRIIAMVNAAMPTSTVRPWSGAPSFRKAWYASPPQVTESAPLHYSVCLAEWYNHSLLRVGKPGLHAMHWQRRVCKPGGRPTQLHGGHQHCSAKEHMSQLYAAVCGSGAQRHSGSELHVDLQLAECRRQPVPLHRRKWGRTFVTDKLNRGLHAWTAQAVVSGKPTSAPLARPGIQLRRPPARA